MTPPATELLIVTALALEQEALLSHVAVNERTQVESVPCCFGELNGWNVAVACFQGMGNVGAAAKTARLLMTLKPQIVLLVGIAGGTDRPITQEFSAKGHLLGDVLVAEQVVDYELGKVTTTSTERRYRAFPSATSLLSAAKAMKPEQWVHRIATDRPDGSTGRVNPIVHFGTFASGEKVIKSETFVQDLTAVWTQLVAVEMESLGVAVACHESTPSTQFIVVKSICDWADPKKDDQWQPYAAASAAAFAIAILTQISPPASSNPPFVPAAASLTSNHKLAFSHRLSSSWRELCDVTQIPLHERDRFDRGDEPRGIWEYLDVRKRLPELPAGLRAIGRADLAEDLENPT